MARNLIKFRENLRHGVGSSSPCNLITHERNSYAVGNRKRKALTAQKHILLKNKELRKHPFMT